MAEAQQRLLGPDGKLHPAEYEITELALVETTNDDPAKVRFRWRKGICFESVFKYVGTVKVFGSQAGLGGARQ